MKSRGCSEFRRAVRLTRRRLLTAGGLGLLGFGLPDLLRAEKKGRRLPARAKSVVFLHQFGGPSHMDTFDMKPDAPEAFRGEFRPVHTSVPGTAVCEHLDRLAPLADRFALVRSVHHKMKNHNSAGYYSLTGHAPPVDDIRLRDTPELFPCYGSVVSRLTPPVPEMPTFIAYPYVLRDGSKTPGQHATFLSKAYDPLFVAADPNSPDFRLPELSLPAGLTADRLGDRRGVLKLIDGQSDLLEYSGLARGLDAYYERAFSLLTSPKVKEAFDLSQETDSVRDAYGRTTYGQSCLLARRLVEAGVRFVTVYFSASIGGATRGGWDTHEQNFVGLKNRLLPITNQTLPTFLADLDRRGLLEETLVVWVGEFGRTPRITQGRSGKGPPAPGRDHWPQCYTALLAGGGTQGGAVYGASDKIAAYPARDPVRPEDIAATLFYALGIDPATEIYSALRQPLPISYGKPVVELFG